MLSYMDGSVLVTEVELAEWYAQEKHHPMLAYFEGPALSFGFARRNGRADIQPLAQMLDKLANDGRIVLVHQRLEADVMGWHTWRYLAQRVPSARMDGCRRDQRWEYNLGVA